MPTELKIKISHEELREGLKKLIHSEHSVLISEVIIANLCETEVGLKQLFMALSGLETVYKFKHLQRVLLDVDKFLYSWNYSKENTQAAGLIHQNCVIGTIIGISKTADKPYKVQYEVRDTSDQPKTDIRWMSENDIVPTEDELI